MRLIYILLPPLVYNLISTTGNSIVSNFLPFGYVTTMYPSLRGPDTVVCDINEGYLDNHHEKA